MARSIHNGSRAHQFLFSSPSSSFVLYSEIGWSLYPTVHQRCTTLRTDALLHACFEGGVRRASISSLGYSGFVKLVSTESRHSGCK
ncbi:hypothetical protein Mapa_015048 [Marchantia paleacea]|nr:hypothetical protein Mapa_015048 [Marchantia paleacea]